MMTRVGGQVEPGSYDDILRQTESDHHRPAEFHARPPPPPAQAYQQQQPAQVYQQQPACYDPSSAQAQTGNFAAGMAPWAGLPGAQPAFEGDAYPPQPDPRFVAPAYQPEPPAVARTNYRDWITVALIVFVLLTYALPHARRFLPSVFADAQAFPAAALLAVTAGCAYHSSNKLWR